MALFSLYTLAWFLTGLLTCSSVPSAVTMVTEWAPCVASSWAGMVMVVPSWVTIVIVPPMACKSASEILTWRQKRCVQGHRKSCDTWSRFKLRSEVCDHSSSVITCCWVPSSCVTKATCCWPTISELSTGTCSEEESSASSTAAE